MKKILTFAAAAALLYGCGNTPQKQYVVEASIDSLTGTVYLMDSQRNLLDSAVVENGSFRLTGSAAQPGILRLSDTPDATGSFNTSFFVEPGTITIAQSPDTPRFKRVTGTPANDANTALNEQSNALVAEARNPETSDERREAIYEEYEKLIRSTYEANRTNMLGAVLLGQHLSYELSGQELLDEIATFSPELQQTELLTQLKERGEKRLKSDVGQTYIDFEQPDSEGRNISLKSVVENPANKYVLLDFWASWCNPCMGEVPVLKKTYDAFHKQGFEIYGVSLDQDSAKWTGAIEKHRMNWIHVSSVSGFKNPAAEAYAVEAIPTNFLIDSKGKIVAKNLRGEALYEKIAELLGNAQ